MMLSGGCRADQPVPRQWFIIVKPRCPFCRKALDLLQSKGQKVLQLRAESKEEARRYEASHDLLAPQSFKTFPQIFNPQREFLGGYSELEKTTFGSCTYSISQDVDSANKERIRCIMQVLAPVWYPHCKFSEAPFQLRDNHVHFELLPGDEMLQHMQDNKHLNCTRQEVEPFRHFSVTFLASKPRIIYLNKSNWDNTTGKTSHFAIRGWYYIYVTLHELGHAIGFVHHLNDDYSRRHSYKDHSSTRHRDCRIMTQQTRPKYAAQCRLMSQPVFQLRFAPYLCRCQKQRVEASLGISLESKQFEQFEGGFKKTAHTRQSQFEDPMADTYSYSQWFETGDTETFASTVSKMTGSGSGSYASIGVSGGTTGYDGQTTVPLSEASGDSSASHASSASGGSGGSVQSIQDVKSDIESDLSERFDSSILTGGGSGGTPSKAIDLTSIMTKSAASAATGVSADAPPSLQASVVSGGDYDEEYDEEYDGRSNVMTDNDAWSHRSQQSQHTEPESGTDTDTDGESAETESDYSDESDTESEQHMVGGFASDSSFISERRRRSESPSEHLDMQSALTRLTNLRNARIVE
jgi:glutaredoxin